MLYERLRNLREDRDLRQQDIADYLNCTQVTYSRYELGNRDIPTETLIKLALYYDTSIDYLLGLTDEKKPYKRKNKPSISFKPIEGSFFILLENIFICLQLQANCGIINIKEGDLYGKHNCCICSY